MATWKPVANPDHNQTSLDGQLGKGVQAPAAYLWLTFASSDVDSDRDKLNGIVDEAMRRILEGVPRAERTVARLKVAASKALAEVVNTLRAARDGRLASIAEKLGDDLTGLAQLQELLQFATGGDHCSGAVARAQR